MIQLTAHFYSPVGVPAVIMAASDDGGANQQLSPATEDERSTAMVDGIARWLAVASAVGKVRSSRRRGFESFPGDRLGNNQGLRNRLREMLGALPYHS